MLVICTPSYAEHDQIAYQAAAEGTVLLRNENSLLPLKAQPVCLYNGEMFRISAVGAGRINPRYTVRLAKGLEDNGYTVSDDTDTAIAVISRASGENYDNNAVKGEFYLSDQERNDILELIKKYDHVIAVINIGYPMDVR